VAEEKASGSSSGRAKASVGQQQTEAALKHFATYEGRAKDVRFETLVRGGGVEWSGVELRPCQVGREGKHLTFAMQCNEMQYN
jgi:hypothetical protein